MKRSILILSLGILLLARGFAQETTTATTDSSPTNSVNSTKPAAPKTPPFIVSGLMTGQSNNGYMLNSKGKPAQIAYFKAQVRVNDKNISSFDTARLYVFNKDKELIYTFDCPDPMITSRTGEQVPVVDAPNLLIDLEGLKENKSYSLVYPYVREDLKWKYAVLVVGTKDVVVTDTLPSSAKAEEFEFKEKEKLFKP